MMTSINLSLLLCSNLKHTLIFFRDKYTQTCLHTYPVVTKTINLEASSESFQKIYYTYTGSKPETV